jgi:glycine cleavage system H protein
MNYPVNYYFTRGHEWININDDIACVGLTELAIKELGMIKKIEISSLGQFLKKEQVFGRVQSDRYLTKLIMPFDGTVIEVNTDPFQYVNEQYFHDHWLIKLKITPPIDKSNLLSLSQYQSYQSVNLLHMVKYLNSKNNDSKRE